MHDMYMYAKEGLNHHNHFSMGYRLTACSFKLHGKMLLAPSMSLLFYVN